MQENKLSSQVGENGTDNLGSFNAVGGGEASTSTNAKEFSSICTTTAPEEEDGNHGNGSGSGCGSGTPAATPTEYESIKRLQ